MWRRIASSAPSGSRCSMHARISLCAAIERSRRRRSKAPSRRLSSIHSEAKRRSRTSSALWVASAIAAWNCTSSWAIASLERSSPIAVRISRSLRRSRAVERWAARAAIGGSITARRSITSRRLRTSGSMCASRLPVASVCSGCRTTVPRPGRRWIRPLSSSSCSASRSDVRDTPSCCASSRSGGSRSSWPIAPSAIIRSRVAERLSDTCTAPARTFDQSTMDPLCALRATKLVGPTSTARAAAANRPGGQVYTATGAAGSAVRITG